MSFPLAFLTVAVCCTDADPVILEDRVVEWHGDIVSIAPTNGRLVAVAVWSNQRTRIHVWDSDRRDSLGTTPPVTHHYFGLRFADGKVVMAGHIRVPDGTPRRGETVLEWWDTASMKKVNYLRLEGGFCGSSTDGKVFLTRSGSSLLVHDSRNWTTDEVKLSVPIRRAALSADGTRAAALSKGGLLSFWDLSKRKATTKDGVDEFPRTIAMSPDGRRVALGAEVFELTDKGIEQRRLAGAHGNAAVFSPNSKYIVYAPTNMLEMFDVRTGRRVARFNPSSPIDWQCRLAFSPDGRILLAGDAKGHLRRWRVPKEFAR